MIGGSFVVSKWTHIVITHAYHLLGKSTGLSNDIGQNNQFFYENVFGKLVTFYVDGAKEATASLRYPTDMNKKQLCHLCVASSRARDTRAALAAKLGDFVLYGGTTSAN